jgi:hypothetical protein
MIRLADTTFSRFYPNTSGKIEVMPTAKLHYDGWIRLPASLCQALGLRNGDRLAVELVDDAVALRSVARRTGQNQETEPPASSASGWLQATAPTSDAVPPRRKPGRPRKNAAAELTPAASTTRRGRSEAALPPEPELAAEPVVRILRKKADLVPAAPAVDQPALPARRPERRSDDGFPFVKRRPFRHVEVRKLGPGRGHNRPQPLPARQRG